MIIGNPQALQQMRDASDGNSRPVSIHLGAGRYADNYRGYTIRQYLWQGPGPAGQWFWQAQDDTRLIGETVLYSGAEHAARREIVHDVMCAIDHMLDDPEWAAEVAPAKCRTCHGTGKVRTTDSCRDLVDCDCCEEATRP